jgi:hypothetical protein
MPRRPLLTILAAGAASAAMLTSALAQTAPPVGAPVKDSKGAPVGVVDKIVYVDGKPRQVLIREGSVVRTLPINGVIAKDGGYAIELTKAEFQILPPAD